MHDAVEADRRARPGFPLAVLDALPQHIYLAAADGHVVFQSAAARRAFGGTVDHVDELLRRFAPADAALALEAFQRRSSDGPVRVPVPGAHEVRWAEYSIIDQLDTPGVEAIMIVSRDVTDRVRLEDDLSRQAMEDQLTGLPNRRALQARFALADAGARRLGRSTGMLMIDLDGFKAVNDTLGHPVGDRLLQGVADRLARVTRGGEMVVRLGGDEFAVLLEQVTSPGAASGAGLRVLEAVREPYDVDGIPIVVQASVGVAIADAAGCFDDLLRHADIALYEAKRRGRNQVTVFEPALEERLFAHSEMHAEIEHAYRKGEYRLVYQPIVDLQTARIRGFEALMRWRSPILGDVPPSQFIPVAEDTGMILRLGRWALEETCRHLAGWHAHQLRLDPGLPLEHLVQASVNVSMVQFDQLDLLDHVEEAITRAGIPPCRLQLEVTESVLAANQDRLASSLRQLRELGVTISLDDFGTGYSSMGQLQGLAVDQIKIDASFVQAVGGDERASSVVTALVELGQALGLTVVAEGVEDADQLAVLRAAGCDFAQGFLLGRPTEALAVTGLIGRNLSIGLEA